MDTPSLFPGYAQEQSDATSAYMQSFLRGIEPWVALPKERWPKEWVNKFENPVVPLILNLYGHADAGGYWEQDCEERVPKCGFVKTEGWRSTFWHPIHKALLVIYVDDFKMAPSKHLLPEVWSELRKH